MKIAIGSDMQTHTTNTVIEYLKELGHDVSLYGAVAGQQPSPWPQVAIEAAKSIAEGRTDQAVLFCWTGTGISMAANKVQGVRSALCTDAETARGARKWNDANALAMSLRLTSEEVAKEIIDAWMEPVSGQDKEDISCINYLKNYDQ